LAAGDVPGDEAEAAAEVAYERARQRREDTSSRLGELRAELAAVADRAGEADVAARGAELAEAQEELAGLQSAEADIERIEDELRRVEAEFEDARDRHEEAVTALAGNRAHRAGLTSEAERLQAAIDEARGEDPTLDARIRRLDREAGLLRDTV